MHIKGVLFPNWYYLSTKLIQEYGSNSSVTVAIGLISRLSNELSLGVYIYNPTRNKLAEFDNERIPTIMKLGLDYHFSEKVILALETEKNIDFDAILRLGIEYHIINKLYLRGGIATDPIQSSFGFGLELKEFKIDFSSSFHQTLGVTPGISLLYTVAK